MFVLPIQLYVVDSLNFKHNGYLYKFYVYYATFQVESGDRMELSVSGTEYGLLAEGDMGKLTFQGTRYLVPAD